MIINLEEVFQRIDTSDADVRVASTLQHLKEMLGIPPQIAAHDLPQLPDRLKEYMESICSLDRDRRPSQAKYNLNRLLRLAVAQGVIHEREIYYNVGFPCFSRPKEKGPDQRRHDAYLAFKRWCSRLRIPFDSLTSNSFIQYREQLKAGNLSSSRKESLYLDLSRFWQEKSEQGMLPTIGLPRWNVNSRRNYGLTRNVWPVGCIAEFEAFERGARNQAREGEKRWRGPLRQISICAMEKELCQYLGYLRNIRSALADDATLLSTLSDREAVIGFIDWHIQDRCGGEARGYHENTLKQLAAFLEWLGGEQTTVDYYKRIASTLKHVRVRDPFPERPMDYQELVDGAMDALREKRLEFENAKTRQERIWAACRFRDALILAMLVCRPIRSRNVREVELGSNLYQEKEDWKLRFLTHQAKARQYICDFPPQLVSWLEFLLAEVRPILLGSSKTKRLFLTKSGKAITAQDLWRRLRGIGQEYLGIPTNPHLFRYLIPSAYLARHPDALDQMQAILGHSTMQTTIRCYVHTYSQVASRKVAEAIRKHCPNFTRLASLYPQQI